MKKLKPFLLVLLSLILLASAFTVADRIRFKNHQRPIFAVRQQGGECISYRGIGYEVLEFFPLLSSEESSSGYNSMAWYWFWE